jgi:rhodanese-related sulfurtransferase
MTVLAAGMRLTVAAAGVQSDELAAVPRISQADFRKALEAGTVLVLDVRDSASYANGHIPGAKSIPLDELTRHVEELRAATTRIVTYCA